MSKKAKIGLGCLSVFLICGIGAYVMPTMGNRRVLEEEKKKAAADGMALTAADMRKNMPPESENAADLYKKAISYYTSPAGKELSERMLKSPRTATPAEYRAYYAMVKKHRELLSTLREAATKQKLYFDRHWEDGANVLFTEYAPIKSFTKMVTYSSHAEADAGNWREATSLLALGYKMSDHMGQEQSVIGGLVQIAMEAITGSGVEHYLKVFASQPAALAHMQKLLDSQPALPDPRVHLRGETVMMSMFFDAIPQMKPGELEKTYGLQGDAFVSLAFRFPAMRDAAYATFLHEHRLINAKIKENHTSWENVDRAFLEADSRLRANTSISGKLTSLFVPVFSGYSRARAADIADRRVLQSSVRILQARISTGRFPPTLPDYGDVSTDPLTSKPLLYKPAPKGFVLYSVGQNKTDEGGSMKDDKEFTFPGPPKP